MMRSAVLPVKLQVDAVTGEAVLPTITSYFQWLQRAFFTTFVSA